jgi:hypothetical protein
VGHAWKHDFTIGNGTSTFKFTDTAIVAKATGTGWILASDTKTNAVSDVGFFLQDLGTMSAFGTLDDGSFVFPWYSFPLSDNKTWTSTEKNVDSNLKSVDRPLTSVAHWVSAGAVPAHYEIEARSGSILRARYDYRPDLGWFGSYEGYDNGSTVHVTTSDSKNGWTGTYYEAAGSQLYGPFTQGFGSPATPMAPTQGSFAMAAGMTDLLLLQFSFGAPGGGSTQVVAPDHTRYSTTGVFGTDPTPLYADSAQGEVIVPAQVGTWQVAAAAEGGFAAGTAVFAWGATVTTGTLLAQ